MKNLLAFFAFVFSISAFAQCTITGKSTIKVLDEETYSVQSGLAQCKECHLWISVGENTQILGDNKLNSVKIKAISGGRQVLSLALLTPQGFVQCSKNIDILDSSEAGILKNNTPESPAPLAAPAQSPKCDIEVNNYKEVKYSENIVTFFPNVTNADYRYEWTANYANGDAMQSSEKVPQFPFTKEKSITTVKLKITSQKCVREFSKTYDASYWKWF